MVWANTYARGVLGHPPLRWSGLCWRLGLSTRQVSSRIYFISVLPIYAEERKFSSTMRGLVIIRRCELGYDFNIILIVRSYISTLPARRLDAFYTLF